MVRATPRSGLATGLNATVSRVRIYQVLITVVALGLWELLSATHLVSTFWISSPSLMVERFVSDLTSGTLLINVGQTLYEAFVAFIISSILGVAAGLYIAQHPVVDAVVAPFITAMNTLPRVALAPLIILWFGIGAASKIITACTLVFFILLVNTIAGAKNTDYDIVTIARLLGASKRDIMLKVTLPSSLPWIFAGLHLGLTYSLLGVVVAEILSSQHGVGYMIANSAGTFDTTGVFEGLFVLVILALGLDQLTTAVERRLLRWRPT